MTDYSRMSKTELVARLKALEQKVPDTDSATSNTALSDSEERMRAILETAVEGIITIDERGLVESMNRAAEKMFGYSAGDVVGRNVSMLMPSPYREAHDGYVRKYVQTGEAKIIGIGREVIGQRKDGTIFPMDLAVSEVRLADRRLFTGFLRDITERKEAQKALSFYAAIVESTEDAIIGMTLKGEIISWNRGAENLFGFSREDVYGRPGSVLIPEDRLEEQEAIAGTIIKGLSIEHFETVRRCKGGKLVDISVTISPIRAADGKIIGASQVARDITERKRAEEKLASLAQTLAEKNKELETIVYIASHDLRSPLVNIQGFSRELTHSLDVLRSKLAPGGSLQHDDAELKRALLEDIPEALEYIQAGVTKIDTLLAGFLRYSRLGRASLKIDRIEMNSMLAGIIQAMEFQLKEAGASVQVGLLPDCVGDSTLISQVFSNLIENAVKYRSPSRPCRVTVSGRVENDEIIYEVRDNGIGIAREHQAKVFEIFHRLNPAASDGDGLGLTITQRIMERHGGKIWLQSEAGQGAVFFVSLPAPVGEA
ncbi:MAG TPA: PAS domain S-box protein [Candidatus Paceibacterota bacterium]|nr:PAS domain S-box protein [Candidatus Paceibacterota bacterium]